MIDMFPLEGSAKGEQVSDKASRRVKQNIMQTGHLTPCLQRKWEACLKEGAGILLQGGEVKIRGVLGGGIQVSVDLLDDVTSLSDPEGGSSSAT